MIGTATVSQYSMSTRVERVPARRRTVDELPGPVVVGRVALVDVEDREVEHHLVAGRDPARLEHQDDLAAGTGGDVGGRRKQLRRVAVELLDLGAETVGETDPLEVAAERGWRRDAGERLAGEVGAGGVAVGDEGVVGGSVRLEEHAGEPVQQAVVLEPSRSVPVFGSTKLARVGLDGVGKRERGLARLDLGRPGVAEGEVVERPVEGHHGELEGSGRGSRW